MSLQFDPIAHAYTVDGVAVPSVTHILAPLNDLSRIPAATLEYKRALGTAVHAATELYDLGDLDESTVDPAVRPYLDAWVRFRTEMLLEIVGMEHRVYHAVHRYAGTYDRLAVMDGKLSVFDIKTGEMYPSYGPQLAAYKNAVEHETGKRVYGRYGIQLRDDGTYRLHEMTDKDDWPVFLSCLTLHRYRNKIAA